MLLRWRRSAVEAHAESGLFRLAQAADAAHADVVGHAGDTLSPAEAEGPERSVEAGKEGEQQHHHRDAAEREDQRGAHRLLQRQFRPGAVGQHQHRGVGEDEQQHVKGEQGVLREQEQGGEQEEAEEDRHEQVPVALQLQQLEAGHDHQQRHAELAPLGEARLLDHDDHAQHHQRQAYPGAGNAAGFSPQEQPQQQQQEESAGDQGRQVPPVRQYREREQQRRDQQHLLAHRTGREHILHRARSAAEAASPNRARASRQCRRWRSPVEGAISSCGSRRP